MLQASTLVFHGSSSTHITSAATELWRKITYATTVFRCAFVLTFLQLLRRVSFQSVVAFIECYTL